MSISDSASDTKIPIEKPTNSQVVNGGKHFDSRKQDSKLPLFLSSLKAILQKSSSREIGALNKSLFLTAPFQRKVKEREKEIKIEIECICPEEIKNVS